MVFITDLYTEMIAQSWLIRHTMEEVHIIESTDLLRCCNIIAQPFLLVASR